MTIKYTGNQNNLEVTLGYFDLDCIVDAIKVWDEKHTEYDHLTKECFDTLKEILKEQTRND